MGSRTYHRVMKCCGMCITSQCCGSLLSGRLICWILASGIILPSCFELPQQGSTPPCFSRAGLATRGSSQFFDTQAGMFQFHHPQVGHLPGSNCSKYSAMCHPSKQLLLVTIHMLIHATSFSISISSYLASQLAAEDDVARCL